MTDWLAMAANPGNGIMAVLSLLGLKVTLGVLRAVRNREFDFRVLPDFLRDDLLTYGIGLVVLFLFGVINPAVLDFYNVAAAAVSAALTRQIFDHVRALFGVEPKGD